MYHDGVWLRQRALVLPHCGIKSQKFYAIPYLSYYTDTGATTSPSIPDIPSAKRATCTIGIDFGMSRPGIKPVPPNLGADTLPTEIPKLVPECSIRKIRN